MADKDAPWLAEAAPLQPERQRSKRPWLNIAIGVLAISAVIAVALLMLLGRKDSGSSEGYMEAAQAPLIEADPGPFKVAPADRQGMEVPGDGEVIHEAVRGQDIEARIDMNALPEAPIGRPRDLLPPAAGTPPVASPGQSVPVQVVPAGPPPAPKPAAQPTPKAAPKLLPPPAATRPPPAVTAAPAAASTAPPKASGTVQIGAFSSEAKAQEEWSRVAGKGGLSAKRIEKITNSSGKTLWRVRGSAADIGTACKAILAANGACEAVKP